MKITKSNYFSVINEIGIDNLSESMKKGYDLVNRVTNKGSDWSKYSTFQKAIEMHFEVLGLWYEKRKEKPQEAKPEVQRKEVKAYPLPKAKPGQKYQHNTPKVKAQKKTAKKPDKKEKPAPVYQKPKVKGKGVELISPEVSFIRRYASLHNKTKTLDQVGSFLRSMQKAIVERRIRKTSRYAKEIMNIQSQLITVYRKGHSANTFRFEEKDLNRLYKIAGAEVVMPTVRFIKAFVGLKGKEITKHKAKNLLDRVKKALAKKQLSPQDKYYKEIRTVINSLEEFLNQSVRKTLAIKESQLNGLEGVLKKCGCQSLNGIEAEYKKKEMPEEKDDGVMTVDEARKAQFRPVPLTGEWQNLIGKMCLPTHFLVYGFGGSGKTSFVLLFTQYMASLGYKILYVAREQYNTPTFTELLNRLNIVVGENFKIVKDIDVLNPKDFDFVVLDSKDDMNIELPSFVKLKEKYPAQSFIMISQGTKDGNFTGTGRWRNVVDVMVFAEKGVIKTGMDKNRWGGSGEMKLPNFTGPDSATETKQSLTVNDQPVTSLEGTSNRTIKIKTEFAVPLEVLASVFFTKSMEDLIIDKINDEIAEVEDEVKRQAQDLILEKKAPVKVKEVKFIENDSEDISHGSSIYEVTLEGNKQDLEQIAGKEKEFYYKW